MVTGASRGLGATLASFLAERGWSIESVARHPPRDAVAGARPVRIWQGDVARDSDRRRLAARVRAGGRRLDLLVHNASELGASPLRPLLEHPARGARRVMETNLWAPLDLTRRLLPELTAARGLVVCISSDAAIGGYPGWGTYGASKAALDLAAKTLAQELRPAGVAVVSVDPGDLRTAMHQAAYPGEDISDRPLPEVTLPFWAWLLGQDPSAVTGQRFRAQDESWKVAG